MFEKVFTRFTLRVRPAQHQGHPVPHECSSACHVFMLDKKLLQIVPLQDQLELIRKSPVYGGFELVTLPWRPDMIASAIRDLSNPIDAIVLPDDFVR